MFQEQVEQTSVSVAFDTEELQHVLECWISDFILAFQLDFNPEKLSFKMHADFGYDLTTLRTITLDEILMIDDKEIHASPEKRDAIGLALVDYGNSILRKECI